MWRHSTKLAISLHKNEFILVLIFIFYIIIFILQLGQIKLPPCHKKTQKTSFKSFIDIKMTFSYLLDIYFIVYNVFFTLNATVKSWGIGNCLVFPGNFRESSGWNDQHDMTRLTWLTCMTWDVTKWHGCHVMLPQVWEWFWFGLFWVFLAVGGAATTKQPFQLSMYAQIGANSIVKKLLWSGYFRIA